jgi:hypothetical protein
MVIARSALTNWRVVQKIISKTLASVLNAVKLFNRKALVIDAVRFACAAKPVIVERPTELTSAANDYQSS